VFRAVGKYAEQFEKKERDEVLERFVFT
jgi:hypothetical protein